MSRFTTLHINTGAVASGADYNFDFAPGLNKVNIGKIKVNPSGSVLGYYLRLYKRATRVDADMQFATKNPSIGDFYVPTDRNGNEVLQGWVLPYEDLDATSQIHGIIHNLDAVSRSFDIYLDYEEPGVNTGDIVHGEVLSALSATQNLAYPPVSGSVQLYRSGLRVANPSGWTISGSVITLVTALIAGEELLADYIKA